MAAPICNIVSNFVDNGYLESSEEVMNRHYSEATLPMLPEVSTGNVGVFTYTRNQEENLSVNVFFKLRSVFSEK